MVSSIRVRGAREHNLKNINVDIPRDKLVVITGLSGSGKSSLAFDTIYAEGQRRYVESLSAYARQFLEMMQKPDVDSIDGLSPAISIEQKTTSKNPRSTVGTVTEIYDYMRLLFARVGIPYSPTTGLAIESQSVTQMVDRILEMPVGSKLYLLAPIIRGRKGEYRKEFSQLQKNGFQRVKVDGNFHLIEELPALEKNNKHNIDVVVDRIVIKDGIANRLADSIETALGLSDGLLFVENSDNDKQDIYSAKFACPVSGFTIEEIEPRLFSFNNPFGACPACDGLGTEVFFDENLVVPDIKKSIKGGAIEPWSKSPAPYYRQTLKAVVKHYNASMNDAFGDLDKKLQQIILYGSGKEEIKFIYDDGKRTYSTKKPFEGVISNMQRRYRETDSNWARETIAKYQSVHSCHKCNGNRLKKEALAVKINHKHIAEITELSIDAAAKWFMDVENHLNKKQNIIAKSILKEINERLGFLNNVGLQYLALNRNSGTLSGGESQRIRLASQIGSGLTGVLYVLDEPSIGLHQRDNERLLITLKRLRDLGNTVIVVEHDEDAIRSADYLIDMGVLAGVNGGDVVAAGLPEEVFKCKESLTAQYITGHKKVEIPANRRKAKSGKYVKIFNASENNLQNIDVSFPLGIFTCVTGVSGSGKSSLVIETLWKALHRNLMGANAIAGSHDKITGIDNLDKVIDIDQSPIGRTPRSNPATYTGAFTPIREWFSALPEAKIRGYLPGRFSFNVKGGRCEACRGDGVIKIEMHFLPDVYVKCDQCLGKRYNRETLEIIYRDKSISDILDMSVDEAAIFFKSAPNIRDKMITLQKVGLGYIKVGQQATTLSGGEAQRVKLAKELSKRATGRTLYILDEPTTGLHFEDVRKLLEVLQTLVDAGNSIIVIEHNLEVIKTADWVIDVGPDGGNNGGKIIAEGTPEDVAMTDGSHTGYYLKDYLNMQN